MPMDGIYSQGIQVTHKPNITPENEASSKCLPLFSAFSGVDWPAMGNDVRGLDGEELRP